MTKSLRDKASKALFYGLPSAKELVAKFNHFADARNMVHAQKQREKWEQLRRDLGLFELVDVPILSEGDFLAGIRLRDVEQHISGQTAQASEEDTV